MENTNLSYGLFIYPSLCSFLPGHSCSRRCRRAAVWGWEGVVAALEAPPLMTPPIVTAGGEAAVRPGTWKATSCLKTSLI